MKSKNKINPTDVQRSIRAYEVKKFTKKYPKIKFIDSKASHNQLISEGINYVLTVNGTISGEYPYFNVNAINASENHSYALYDFSITPKNRLEYIKLINNLKKPKAINKENFKKFDVKIFFPFNRPVF